MHTVKPNAQLRPAEATLAGVLFIFLEVLVMWGIAHFMFGATRFDYVVPGAPFTPLWAGGALLLLGLLFFNKTRTILLSIPGSLGRIIFTTLFMYATVLTAGGVILLLLAAIHYMGDAKPKQAMMLVAGLIAMIALAGVSVHFLRKLITSSEKV